MSDRGAIFLSGLVFSTTRRLPMPNTGRVFLKISGRQFLSANVSINFRTPYFFEKNERREASRDTSVRNESALRGCTVCLAGMPAQDFELRRKLLAFVVRD